MDTANKKRKEGGKTKNALGKMNVLCNMALAAA
jgi:hypothetical protein